MQWQSGSDFFAMGGYAAFIWPAYALTAAVLIGLWALSLRSLRLRAKLVGITNHSTSQNATTSSHTMAPGSATPMCCAVTVQAHQPSGTDMPISKPMSAAFKNWSINT